MKEWMSLRFQDQAMEHDYMTQRNKKNILFHRVLYSISIPFYLVFAFVDIKAVPNALPTFWGVRFGIFTPIAFVALFLTFTKYYTKLNDWMMVIIANLSAYGMLFLTFVGARYQFYSYRFGLLFGLIFLTVLSRVDWIKLLFSTVILNAVYFIASALNTNVPKEIRMDTNILVISVSLMGLFSAYMFEQSERKQFKLSQLLKNEKEKIIVFNEELEEKVSQRTKLLYDANKKLKVANDRLLESDTTFKKLFDESADAILLMQDWLIVNCNKSLVELLGYSSFDDLLGKPVKALINKDAEAVFAMLKETVLSSDHQRHLIHQWWLQKKSGEAILTEVKMTQIEIDEKQVVHFLIRDITERYQLEQNLEYLSYHDSLTNLYNRRFFEEELKRLDVPRNLPISIIFADVNGLKLINDYFGHQSGDELLIKISDSFKEVCRSDEIIARLGGDEFVILLTHTDTSEAMQLIERLRSNVTMKQVKGIHLSVAFGVDTKLLQGMDMATIIQSAERNMYYNKNKESPAFRSLMEAKKNAHSE
ncbi:MAG: hypothetical protein BGO41_06840 [Clostridiales bacterium 38-18]|nr:MAG: hypothetical protein BGO41_06840 [Clostridiales bacterium 38-18]